MFMRSLPVLTRIESNENPEPIIRTTQPPEQHYGQTDHSERCEDGDCRSRPNLLGPVVGSLCAIFVVILVGIFILWFYLRRKRVQPKETPRVSSIRYIEQPPLYTSAVSTANSMAPLYASNSIADSHYYERIDHGQES